LTLFGHATTQQHCVNHFRYKPKRCSLSKCDNEQKRIAGAEMPPLFFCMCCCKCATCVLHIWYTPFLVHRCNITTRRCEFASNGRVSSPA
jgi:hypothetical protein